MRSRYFTSASMPEGHTMAMGIAQIGIENLQKCVRDGVNRATGA